MMRVLFGLLLALLLSVPSLLDVVLTAVAYGLGHPPVVAFAAGVVAWPRIVSAVRGWGR
ncbi:hypothetical protein [Streptomyces sp. NPDC058254]|uniref:hypothetical protein n=1 Tax=Streptomyces sp. NPDC058254 TaxID=3346406 RepID=UPI0036E5D3C7